METKFENVIKTFLSPKTKLDIAVSLLSPSETVNIKI